jgi:hypothetical protein
MVLIELHLAPGKRTFELSEEILRETQAQVMTHEQAVKVGFEGLPAPPADTVVFYVAVAPRDARWILNALEADPSVGRFQMHEVG